MRVLSYIDPSIARTPRQLAAQCRAKLFDVVRSNVDLIQARRRMGRPLPSIYQSGVWFTREPWCGLFEEFADITTCLRRGWLDCDDACAWRLAEYWDAARREVGGIKIYWRPEPNGEGIRIFHAQVRKPDGGIEDPSRRLPGG
jgi:hypothetical protein